MPPDPVVPAGALPPRSAENTESAEAESFAFVLNVARLADASSYSLPVGHQLRRATHDEIVQIKETMRSLGPRPNFVYERMWEVHWPPRGNWDPLPEEDWHYFVIAFRDTNHTMVELERVFDMCRSEIELGFTVVNVPGGGQGTMLNTGRLFHVLEDATHNPSLLYRIVRKRHRGAVGPLRPTQGIRRSVVERETAGRTVGPA